MVESLRDAKDGRRGRASPTDLCVWGLGEAPRREMTKVGGVPYLRRDVPWPKSGRKPWTFFFQINFADSRDLVDDLPGDVLTGC